MAKNTVPSAKKVTKQTCFRFYILLYFYVTLLYPLFVYGHWNMLTIANLYLGTVDTMRNKSMSVHRRRSIMQHGGKDMGKCAHCVRNALYIFCIHKYVEYNNTVEKIVSLTVFFSGNVWETLVCSLLLIIFIWWRVKKVKSWWALLCKWGQFVYMSTQTYLSTSFVIIPFFRSIWEEAVRLKIKVTT